MLQITGKTLDVTVETVQGTNGPFDSTTIYLLSGEGATTEVHQVKTGFDFRTADLPKRDEKVTLNVTVTAFPYKSGGAGFRLVAASRASVAAAAPRLAPTGS